MKKNILILSAFLLSVTAQAQLVKWTNAYAGLGEYTLPREMSVSGNENLAFAGTVMTTGSQYGGYLYKTDSAGTIQWSDMMELSNPEWDGTSYFMTSGLSFDQAENLFFAMNFNDTLQFASSSYPTSGMKRCIFVKYLDNGTKQFLLPYDNMYINSITHDMANNTVVLITFSGTINFFGQSFTANGASDILVVKLNPSNTILLSKQISGGTASGTKILSTALGNLVLLGNYTDTLFYDGVGHSWSHDGTDDGFVMKISPTGTVLGYASAVATIQEKEDDIAVSFDDKIAMSAHGSWTYNGWTTLKTYDAAVMQTSAKNISDDDYGSAHLMTDLVTVGSDGFWGSGFTRISNIEGDPDDDSHYLAIYKHDFMGNLMEADSFAIAGNYYDPFARAMAVGHAGNFYMTAPLEGSITMEGHTATAPGTQDGFLVVKFNETPDVTTSVNDNMSSSFSLFPNPGTGTFTISAAENNSMLNIYDLAGKLVFSSQLNSGKQLVNTPLPSGVYAAELVSGKSKSHSRLVVLR
jgi:hypothetical protein